jgi:hypothetical protein
MTQTGTQDLRSVVALLEDQSMYHNHKEVMAHGAAALYIGGAAALLAGPAFWLGWDLLQRWLFLSLALATAIGGLLYIGWQLHNRRVAGERSQALYDHLREQLPDELQATVTRAAAEDRIPWWLTLGLSGLWGAAITTRIMLTIL